MALENRLFIHENDCLYRMERLLKKKKLGLFYQAILPIHKFFPYLCQIHRAYREFPSERAARDHCAQRSGYDLMAEAGADDANTILG